MPDIRFAVVLLPEAGTFLFLPFSCFRRLCRPCKRRALVFTERFFRIFSFHYLWLGQFWTIFLVGPCIQIGCSAPLLSFMVFGICAMIGAFSFSSFSYMMFPLDWDVLLSFFSSLFFAFEIRHSPIVFTQRFLKRSLTRETPFSSPPPPFLSLAHRGAPPFYPCRNGPTLCPRKSHQNSPFPPGTFIPASLPRPFLFGLHQSLLPRASDFLYPPSPFLFSPSFRRHVPQNSIYSRFSRIPPPSQQKALSLAFTHV